MEYLVTSPIGGFGNHVRWLLLLDDKFNCFQDDVVALRWDKELYNDLKGSSWPTFDNFELMPNWVKYKCHDRLPSTFLKYDDTPKGKSSFIMEHVYHEKRTWHNWLGMEWEFRIWANKYIAFEHEAYGAVSIHHDGKFRDAIIAVHTEPEFAYKRYLKFNSSNNGKSKEQTIIEIEEYNSKILNNPTTTIIDANVLYNEHLDEELYSKCIDAFSLEDNYKYASEIHKQWYKLHENAEFEFVRDITNMYRKQ